jgi:hypothetical protein
VEMPRPKPPIQSPFARPRQRGPAPRDPRIGKDRNTKQQQKQGHSGNFLCHMRASMAKAFCLLSGSPDKMQTALSHRGLQGIRAGIGKGNRRRARIFGGHS